MRSNFLLLLLAALFLAACRAPATALVVEVRSEPALVPSLRAVRVIARRAGAMEPFLERTYPLEDFDLPGEITLVPKDPSDARMVEIEIRTQLDDPSDDFAVRYGTIFVAGQTRRLTVVLADGCRASVAPACGERETCGESGCERRERNELPEIPPDASMTTDAMGADDAAVGDDVVSPTDTIVMDTVVSDVPAMDVARPDVPTVDVPGMDVPAVVCTESATRACYDGASTTRGVGVCRDGVQTCRSNAWSLCAGQVVPSTTDTCGNRADDDCDGTVDEMCAATVVGMSSGIYGWARCLLMSDGAVRCFGDNTDNMLAVSSGSNAACTNGDPCRTTITPVPAYAGARAVCIGAAFSCAITASKTVVCTGNNEEAQLGDGTTTNRATPRAVQGLPAGIEEIVCSAFSVCARTSTGAVRCWGQGSTSAVAIPNVGAGVTALAAGNGSYCALMANGTARCWGVNRYGELGIGGATMAEYDAIPVVLSDRATLLSGVVEIRAADGAFCARKSDGTIVCWGATTNGRITHVVGEPTVTATDGTRFIPYARPIAITNASSLASGAASFCAGRTNGEVYCWGSDRRGQIGDGPGSELCVTENCRTTPTIVPLIAGATMFSGGPATMCARGPFGTRCAGSNLYGELGTGAFNEVWNAYTNVSW